MQETAMAVVMSEEAREEQKFDGLGLNIRPHRVLMTTSFDTPTISTLYLNKLLQNHTLMQTIVRANRVAGAPDTNGRVATPPSPIAKTYELLLDYYGLMDSQRLEKALLLHR